MKKSPEQNLRANPTFRVSSKLVGSRVEQFRTLLLLAFYLLLLAI
jgi:hypothetical protein